MAENTGWKDPYEEKLKGYLQQMESREPFSFDVDKDAMYQQLRDNYERQGKLAMEDTMGQAAALTGGYGNSYAQSVGQQVYNQHMQQLSDTVPELYGLALDRYQQEGKDLQAKYDFYKGLSDESYNKYLLENGLVGEDSASYDVFTSEAQDEWAAKFNQDGFWGDYMNVWKNMTFANLDPLQAADLMMQNAEKYKYKPTGEQLLEFAMALGNAGVSMDSAYGFISEWADKLNIYIPQDTISMQAKDIWDKWFTWANSEVIQPGADWVKKWFNEQFGAQ